MSNLPMTDDRVLVSNVLNGDRQAFRQLIQRHERLVAHMIGRIIRNNEECEEVCQDVFLRVYQKLNEFKFQSKLSTWIATIAYRYAINHIRKNKQERDCSSHEEEFEHFSEMETPESLLEQRDIDNYLLKLTEYLPAQYKAVLTLYHLENLNYGEIVEITGMPEGTVKNYLFRARTMLKEKVKKYLGKEELL